MKIGVIQAASQIEKNSLLYRCTLDAVKQYDYEVINFGCFENEAFSYSYVEIAVAISFLPSSGAVDFVVTGCSSGQGMMLAYNSMPGVLCGLAVRAQDAFLFGRINDGNAISIPLGNGFGWDGEENLKSILKELLRGPFGSGYPAREAERKERHAAYEKAQRHDEENALSVYCQLDKELVRKVLRKQKIAEYIIQHAKNRQTAEFIRKAVIETQDRKEE